MYNTTEKIIKYQTNGFYNLEKKREISLKVSVST